MDECFDVDTSVDVVDTNFDVPDIEIEPFDVADEVISETPTEMLELAELQQEAESLEIEPLDDGIDLGYNYDEAIAEANAQWEAEEQAYNPSTLENMISGGADGMMSPSEWAQIGGEIIAPPGAGEVTAQGLQAGLNVAIAGSEGLMEAAYNQHAFEPPPLEGVDYFTNESGEIEPIRPMVSAIDSDGEPMWVRSENDIGDEEKASKNGWIKDVAIGGAAVGVMAASALKPIADVNEYPINNTNNEVSAIVEIAPLSSHWQAVGEFAGQFHEAAEAWHDGQRQREELEDALQIGNALREPVPGEYRDLEEG
jgi:hypothetical protein